MTFVKRKLSSIDQVVEYVDPGEDFVVVNATGLGELEHLGRMVLVTD